MQKINLLNPIVNKDVDKTAVLDRYQFYKTFLYLLDINRSSKLSKRELEALAFIMAHTEGKEGFTGADGAALSRKLNMKSPNTFKIRNNLIKKGLWGEDGLKIALKAFKSLLDDKKEISIVFNIKMDD